MDYYQSLSKLHRVIKPSVYLEIGVRNGESLQLAVGKTKCIGIDPNYDIQFPYLHDTQLIKDTSDDFFAGDLPKRLLGEQKVDLAFIDGMHLFEFVLRDFINVEKYSHRNSVIVLHDCIPKDVRSSARERTTNYWTGDVWKVPQILRQYRPDLSVEILDSTPSGLAIISNLNPASEVLSQNYEQILKEFTSKKLKLVEITSSNSEQYNFNKHSRNRTGNWLETYKRKLLKEPKALGVMLCYNDSDILEDAIKHLIANNHALIVWDHGSDDGTSKILDKYQRHFVERKFVPRSFDFYGLYPAMSKHLIDQYLGQYDWISWPDQDELLEGPDRRKSYYQHLVDIFRSKYDWIEFNNHNYWFTTKDDATIVSPVERIKYYSLFPDCAPRIRSWRATSTNIRQFNHNPPEGQKYPTNFNLRHYPMRSLAQAKRRLTKDRADIRRDTTNLHYDKMINDPKRLIIDSKNLHYDDGKELNPEVTLDWKKVYF